MTQNQLMASAAVALAAYAAWQVLKRPGAAVASNAGQAARDAGLQAWHSTVDWSWRTVAPSLANSQANLTGSTLGQ